MKTHLIYLINPKADCFTSKPLILKKALYSPLAGLLQIASLFPRDRFEVILTDENIEPVDLDLQCSLVGISAMTSYVKRGYEIADHFMRRNVPVIMGGVHPSFMPQEALAHADAMCVGEAELVFPGILADLDAGCLKGVYKADRLCDMATILPPRMDLIKRNRYFNRTFIQTARGCPTACSFCAEHLMYGTKYRFRPIEDVIQEIAACEDKTIAINDVDVFSTRERTRELLTALKPLNKNWQGAVSCRHAQDEELLELAAESGCNMLSIGFESISRGSLRSVHKLVNNPDTYAELIDKMHGYGMMVFGLFMFGFDNDSEESFVETLRFAIDHKIDMCGFSIVTPYPGTLLFFEMMEEKRITSYNWDKYDQGAIVYQTRGIPAESLWKGHSMMYERFYSTGSMLRRFPFFKKRAKSLWLIMNLFFRRGEVSGIDVPEPIVVDDTILEYLPEVPLMPARKDWRDAVAATRLTC
ncbi:MAG: radical SAM protein [Thermodesulfobacteriota bacterium]|jgi:radical SAM superfamily enzyme YgiQ (UPF0313 family)